MHGEGEGRRKMGVKDIWGEGKEEGEGKKKGKEKGGRKEKRKTAMGTEKERKIHWFPHVLTRTHTHTFYWTSVRICIMFSESSLT